MNPFRISCTTCRARLKITDPAAVGQILACPKCGSMVNAVPPAGWSLEEPAAGRESPTKATVASAESTSVELKPKVVNTLAAGAATANEPKAAAQKASAPKASAVAACVRAASPPLVSPAAAYTAAPAASAGLTAPPEASVRWFWPALSVGTFLSVALVGLLLWIDHKNHSSPIVAAEANPQQSAPEGPSATDSVKSSAPSPNAKPSTALPIAPSQPSDSSAHTGTGSEAKSSAPVSAPLTPSRAANDDRPVPTPTAPPSGRPAEPNTKPADPSATAQTAAAPPAAADTKPHDPPVVEPAPGKQPAVEADVGKSVPPAGRPVRPSVERIPPRTVDVASRLTDPLAAVNYLRVPLAQLLDELSQWSTIPISLDADALSELTIAPDVPVTLRLKETTISGVLDEALSPLGLSYSVVNGQLLIGRPRQADFRRVRYAVADLAGETAESTSQFAAVVHAIIDPPS
ncbi:MAG TPA: hypothetical protein VGY55_22325, partial [Pirellulales bacterium]|nr:hypothetical protein [Pirellulales bacterium]